MILEITQMLYTSHHVNGTILPDGNYKKSHSNHPMNIWIRTNQNNYLFAVETALELCFEYTHRYSKIHSCQKHLLWLKDNIPTSFKKEIYKKNVMLAQLNDQCSLAPLCMPDIYKIPGDLIGSYRNYYLQAKKRFARWTNRSIPPWFIYTNIKQFI
jgi:hypothetical protein